MSSIKATFHQASAFNDILQGPLFLFALWILVTDDERRERKEEKRLLEQNRRQALSEKALINRRRMRALSFSR